MPLTVSLLSLCQALLVSGNILLIAVSPLIGAQLAPSPTWSTAPVATQWLGLMCATIPASLIMARLGRRRGFMLGNLLGLAGVALALKALTDGAFPAFLVATWLIGIGIGFGQLYRFAAVEAAPAALRDRAIGLVMGGGVLAAFFGPWLARHSRELAEVPFLGSFLGLGALYLLALGVLTLIRLPAPASSHGEGEARPLAEILRQPSFVVAVTAALIGYGVMNLAMTATPLAMADAALPFDQVATTIQWHVVAMFLPSFVTGRLTARFGASRMIAAGCGLLAGSALIAQLDAGVAGFHAGLILLGLGWNFTFLPATGLLTEAYRPAEKARTQAANEFLVFSTVALTALAAGPLVDALGWPRLNALLLPLCLLPVLALAWRRLASRRRVPQIPSQ
ncbi:MFS transporter [Halomonas koreensis]|uniref:MFS transporter n=1 Tax=Halomonas koreensis TaxID=245385 RepID=A0ABU1G3S4_9GAMM|nr:MFS transporter [Halomonas koreensis]MDR5867587.1 MFS transporter [Halomonas koreensis]